MTPVTNGKWRKVGKSIKNAVDLTRQYILRCFCRRRQNLLTLYEMTRLYRAIIFYVHLESGIFLLMYKHQDRIGPDNVFNVIHTLYAVFDFSLLVCARQSSISNICHLYGYSYIRWYFRLAYFTRATQGILRCGLTLNQGDIICEGHVSKIISISRLQQFRMSSLSLEPRRESPPLSLLPSSSSPMSSFPNRPQLNDDTSEDICQGAALMVVVDVHWTASSPTKFTPRRLWKRDPNGLVPSQYCLQ